MKEESKNDGFSEGLTKQSEDCAWCNKTIRQYIRCYYGGKRVGNVIICAECGDKASSEEDDAKYRN